jgi:hypothetical protein
MPTVRELEAVALGALAPDAVVEGADGRPVRLSDFWRERPTVFVFLRHFG